MTPNEYQELAEKTLTPECDTLSYLGLGLAGESGEVAEVVKKYIRGDFDWDILNLRLMGELGDVIWYLSNIARKAGINLEDCMRYNIQKLQARQANNTIKGDGDER